MSKYWRNVSSSKYFTLKKSLRETQTLRDGCSKAEPKILAPPQTPFPRVRDGQNLISWRWTFTTTNPVWWGPMHAISSYHSNRPTNTQTHATWLPARPLQTCTQTGLITIHCAAKLSAQCKYELDTEQTRSSADADNRLDAFSGQSRSTNIVPLHVLHIVSYSAIVTCL